MVGHAFWNAPTPIRVHFDVGNNYQGSPYVVPAQFARRRPGPLGYEVLCARRERPVNDLVRVWDAPASSSSCLASTPPIRARSGGRQGSAFVKRRAPGLRIGTGRLSSATSWPAISSVCPASECLTTLANWHRRYRTSRLPARTEPSVPRSPHQFRHRGFPRGRALPVAWTVRQRRRGCQSEKIIRWPPPSCTSGGIRSC